MLFRRRLVTALVSLSLISISAHAAGARRWDMTPSLRSEKPLMLVSDIDDTIKRTHVLSTRGTILNGPRTRNSFQGMSDLYVAWACDTTATTERARCRQRQSLTRTADRLIAYVTAAKGKLQMFGSLFLKNSGFPIGLFIGRDQSDAEVSALFATPAAEVPDPPDLPEKYPPTLDYKIATVRKLIEDYPEYDFILIGDNGEKDVPAYHAVTTWARTHRSNTRIHTFIHQVYDWQKGVPPADGQSLYVTAGDLGLELYRRGLLSEEGLGIALTQTLRALQRDEESVFPDFLDCEELLAPGRLPQMPDDLTSATAAQAERLLRVLKRYCDRSPLS
ncbi:MAG: App1 family protein [Bdellovibrionaceae bacterium]|nr:App1 family protein [Pseudobdellovibrionaceae bacterium]